MQGTQRHRAVYNMQHLTACRHPSTRSPDAAQANFWPYPAALSLLLRYHEQSQAPSCIGAEAPPPPSAEWIHSVAWQAAWSLINRLGLTACCTNSS